MGVARRMYNVFEDALPPRRAQEIDAIKNLMIQHGALGASMSGTGPTVFGLFESRTGAESAFAALREQYPETFLTQTVGNLLEQVKEPMPDAKIYDLREIRRKEKTRG